MIKYSMRKFCLLLCWGMLEMGLGNPAMAAEAQLYRTAADSEGGSLFASVINAQGGELLWAMELSVVEGKQKVIAQLRGKSMGRQSRSAVITHGTRTISDKIKTYLDQNSKESQASEREEVNLAKDFLEETLRDILRAPRMSDLQEEGRQSKGARTRYPDMPIDIDVVLFDGMLTIINHDVPGQTFDIKIPAQSVNAFVKEMQSDPVLGKYVIIASD